MRLALGADTASTSCGAKEGGETRRVKGEATDLTDGDFPGSVWTMETQSVPVVGKHEHTAPQTVRCWSWFSFTYYRPPGGAGGA